nr:hypothetical protein [Mycoplasma todarodis]
MVKIKVSKNSIDKILMNSQDVILVNKDSKMRIKLMHKYYDVTIEEIEDKKDGKTEVVIKEKIPDFTIGSTLEARIIYSSIPVWEKIIER